MQQTWTLIGCWSIGKTGTHTKLVTSEGWSYRFLAASSYNRLTLFNLQYVLATLVDIDELHISLQPFSRALFPSQVGLRARDPGEPKAPKQAPRIRDTYVTAPVQQQRVSKSYE